jgi:hypothetical protein
MDLTAQVSSHANPAEEAIGDVPALQLREVSKSYGATQAVRGIDLRIERDVITRCTEFTHSHPFVLLSLP